MTSVEKYLLGPLGAGWRAIKDFCGLDSGASYLWPRWLVLRAVGLVYIVIFSGIIAESSALIGPNGLLPVPRLIEQAKDGYPSILAAILNTPSLFWLNGSPAMIEVMACVGCWLPWRWC